MKPETEPVRLSASVQAFVTAVIALAVAFGLWSPTDAQVAALLGVIIAAQAVAASWTRRRVTPVRPSGNGCAHSSGLPPA